MGGLIYPEGMRSRQALLWSAENKRVGDAEEPGSTESHPFISNLCTHTLTHHCTCAHAHTHCDPPPPNKASIVVSVSARSNYRQLGWEHHFIHPHRASSLPLIIHSCQVKQPTAKAALLDAASPLRGQSVASVPGRGDPRMAEIVLLSDIFDFTLFWKCVSRFVLVRAIPYI